tara:strand:+ start:880 stop:2181 length:1302 start_codon:yes stop_codon:yes gene_type:complete
MINNSKQQQLSSKSVRIAVIGLGYVGLPLAVEFGKNRSVIGFDINLDRINELKNGIDSTLEVNSDDLKKSKNLEFTNNIQDIDHCNVYIITVPTPIDNQKCPDLSPLIKASNAIGKVLKEGDIVIYESTVYPGATEEICVPILEKVSSLKYNINFFVGYSPERINPGDKAHSLTNIMKVTSGSTPEIADFIDSLYASIISAGTHKAESIKVAEAAKVIENTQRDLNIALINELSQIFNKMNIDTESVLNAAGTKWNFLPFRPGLVGGHCIGVDPYYLTHKAEAIGYSPKIILAGRHQNDSMGEYVAEQLVNAIVKKGIKITEAKILIMGLTFKENCPDLRNTKVIDVITNLKNLGLVVDVWDPWVDATEALEQHGISPIKTPEQGSYEGIILAVAHDEFVKMGAGEIKKFGAKNHIIYDLKYILSKEDSDIRL